MQKLNANISDLINTDSCKSTAEFITEFLTRSDLATQGTLGNIWGYSLSQLAVGGGACYWQRVGQGQRWSSASHSAQDTPTTKNDLGQNANSIAVDKYVCS